ncbi:hypothetical protein [Streptomyces sp. NPDC102437]|uniref:hypothetical protein n=1 Tax=Streptomyces sp. NPDC102437 TaxID=3366175 RepID=UPI00380E3735
MAQSLTDVLLGCPATVLSGCQNPFRRWIREEEITRLSPLKHRNLNVLGRYSFTTSTPAAGALRPLGDAGISGGRVLGNRKSR